MYMEVGEIQKILNTQAIGINLINEINMMYSELQRTQKIMKHIKFNYPILWCMVEEDMERLLKPLEDTKDERRH